MAEAYAASAVTDAVKSFIASDRYRDTHLIVVQRLSGSDRFFVVGGNDGFGGNGSVGRNEDVVDESAVPVNRLLADEINLFFLRHSRKGPIEQCGLDNNAQKQQS